MTDIKFETIDKPEYKLVPVEPTEEMLCAAVAHRLHTAISNENDWGNDSGILYKKMLSAAPAAPTTLEPVAEFDWNQGKFVWLTKYEYYKHNKQPLVRQSDAAAIIASKDAEIEQHRNNIAEFIRDADKKEETLRAEVERLTRERYALVSAIDNEMVVSHIGVFNLGDDPKIALNKLMCYAQGLGEYFAKEQLAAVTKERNSFQDQCVRMRHERHVEKEQLAAERKDAERYDELCANPEGGAHLLRLLRDGKGGRDGLNNILDRCRLGRLAAMRRKESK